MPEMQREASGKVEDLLFRKRIRRAALSVVWFPGVGLDLARLP